MVISMQLAFWHERVSLMCRHFTGCFCPGLWLTHSFPKNKAELFSNAQSPEMDISPKVSVIFTSFSEAENMHKSRTWLREMKTLTKNFKSMTTCS